MALEGLIIIIHLLVLIHLFILLCIDLKRMYEGGL